MSIALLSRFVNNGKNISPMTDNLSYDPDTGIFTWKVSRGRCKAGDQAGTLDDEGYRSIQIDGKKIRAASIAWFIMKGCWPDQVDHIDRNPDNNRWKNLRETTHQQNCYNRKRTQASGFTGVYPKGKRWVSKIRLDGKNHHLGTFDTPELASAAYQQAAKSSKMKEYFPDA